MNSNFNNFDEFDNDLNTEIEENEMFDTTPVIKIVGVGGGGGNAIKRMVGNDIKSVEYIAVNTDCQALRLSPAEIRVQIGKNITKGLGAGADPQKGKQAALESEEELKEILSGADLVFVTTGMGGGTGTGASPVIARIAKELGAVVVGIVTKPFGFEGKRRMQNALQGIDEMRPFVDTLIIVPNDKILDMIGTNTTYLEAFTEVDNVLLHGVEGIADIIDNAGIVNVDFADIKTVLSNKGTALMGIGAASGPNRAIEAARLAISSPLLEIDINGATDAIVQITGDEVLTMKEVEDIVTEIRNASTSEIDVIHGTRLNDRLSGEVIVTVIATGFDLHKNENDNVEPKQELQEPRVKPVVGGGSTKIDENKELKDSKVPTWLQGRYR